MDRFDVVLVGLDPERDKDDVLAALARRLARSGREIDERLAEGPVTLARSLDADVARRLLDDLRALGARVKPVDAVAELPPEQGFEQIEHHPSAPDEGEEHVPRAPDPEPDAASTRPKLVFWSVDEDGYERPRTVDALAAADAGLASGADAPPPAEMPPAEVPPAQMPPAETPSATPAGTPIVVRDDDAALAPKSLPKASMPPGPAVAPTALSKPPPAPARFGRAERILREPTGPPRVFYAALRTSLVRPLAQPLLPPLALSGALALTASLGVTFGVRLDLPFGPLLVSLAALAAVGLAGLVTQLAGACLAAAASGDPRPAPLPGRLLADYLAPGGQLAIVIGVLVALGRAAAGALASAHVRAWAIVTLVVLVAIYAVLGFVLSAASGGALAFLGVGRMASLVARAPLATAVVVALGLVALGAPFGAAAWALSRVLAPIGASGAAGCVAVVALAGLAMAYGAGLVGSLTGQLLYATGVDAPRS